MRGGRRCELSGSTRLPERQHLGVIELHVGEGALLLRELPADKVHGRLAQITSGKWSTTSSRLERSGRRVPNVNVPWAGDRCSAG